ncbi:hypothetical protein I7I48_00022 [Histoplasma ohiense]|nr:hypothetical protein I7I48_00022 [Histoplasma ohiense (nom. inval.)]
MLCTPAFAMHYSAIDKMLTSHTQESLSQQHQSITNQCYVHNYPLSFTLLYTQSPLLCSNHSTHLSPPIKCLAPLSCNMASDHHVSHHSDCIMRSIVSTPHCQSTHLAYDHLLSSSDVPPTRDLTPIEEIAYNNVAGVDNDNVATPVNNQNVSKAVGEDMNSDGSICDDDEMMNVSVLSPAAVSPALVHASTSPALSSTSLIPINPPSSSYTDSSLSPTL